MRFIAKTGTVVQKDNLQKSLGSDKLEARTPYDVVISTEAKYIVLCFGLPQQFPRSFRGFTLLILQSTFHSSTFSYFRRRIKTLQWNSLLRFKRSNFHATASVIGLFTINKQKI